jgi:hypothetical protein
MRFAFSFVTAVLLTASQALGHPGHGVTDGDSTVHYLTEPLHIGPVVVLVSAGVATAVWLKRRKRAAVRVREK